MVRICWVDPVCDELHSVPLDTADRGLLVEGPFGNALELTRVHECRLPSVDERTVVQRSACYSFRLLTSGGLRSGKTISHSPAVIGCERPSEKPEVDGSTPSLTTIAIHRK